MEQSKWTYHRTANLVPLSCLSFWSNCYLLPPIHCIDPGQCGFSRSALAALNSHKWFIWTTGIRLGLNYLALLGYSYYVDKQHKHCLWDVGAGLGGNVFTRWQKCILSSRITSPLWSWWRLWRSSRPLTLWCTPTLSSTTPLHWTGESVSGLLCMSK